MQENYIVGIYARLSRDDERAGESVSIENQKEMPCGTQPACLHVEAEIDHVAVLDHIVLALGAQQALFLGRSHAAAAGHHLVEIDSLSPNEAPLNIGVDLACGLGSLGALLMVQARHSSLP